MRLLHELTDDVLHTANEFSLFMASCKSPPSRKAVSNPCWCLVGRLELYLEWVSAPCFASFSASLTAHTLQDFNCGSIHVPSLHSFIFKHSNQRWYSGLRGYSGRTTLDYSSFLSWFLFRSWWFLGGVWWQRVNRQMGRYFDVFFHRHREKHHWLFVTDSSSSGSWWNLD